MPIGYETVARDRDKNLRLGALIMVKPEYKARVRRTPTDTLLVVFADKFDMVNCVVVGGNAADPRAYFRVPATWVRVVDPAAVIMTGIPARA
jgi:hypothetical protein